MVPIGNGTVSNGKVHSSRVGLQFKTVDAVRPSREAFVRSSHSLSLKVAKKVRALAYRVRASESAVIECALWAFFDKGLDADTLALMNLGGIKPRRRRA
jgi:hypothetical protein